MGEKVLCENKKVRHDYFIEESYEAGIALQGTEVKSLRLGKANLKDSYARVSDGEVYLYDLHISPYSFGNRFNHDPLRVRKLLLHKAQINRLYGKSREKGLTLVPLKMYFKKGKVKVELGVGRGKKIHDKREDLRLREDKRAIERGLHSRNRER